MQQIGPTFDDLQHKVKSITGTEIALPDHIGAFDQNVESWVLKFLNEEFTGTVWCEYIFDQQIKEKYSNLDLRFSLDLWLQNNYIKEFEEYNIHPERNLKNFLCTFNGGRHVSRKLLTAITERFNWFKIDYSTKNFIFNQDEIYGHVDENVHALEQFYNKFFKVSDQFANQMYGLDYTRFDHKHNINVLSLPITESFIHIVSETMATSFYPFITEKFLYSVSNRGLFLAYAQPGWHAQLENVFGFKPFKIFDYKFDSIANPIVRIVELFTMISKFSILDIEDWNDLYQMEFDTIEYNYDHFYSGNYKKCLENIA